MMWVVLRRVTSSCLTACHQILLRNLEWMVWKKDKCGGWCLYIYHEDLVLFFLPWVCVGQMAKRTRETVPDPCLQDRIHTYLNNPQVQKALHVKTTHRPFKWESCSLLVSLVLKSCSYVMSIDGLLSQTQFAGMSCIKQITLNWTLYTSLHIYLKRAFPYCFTGFNSHFSFSYSNLKFFSKA